MLVFLHTSTLILTLVMSFFIQSKLQALKLKKKQLSALSTITKDGGICLQLSNLHALNQPSFNLIDVFDHPI